jgi:hypothetical protein
MSLFQPFASYILDFQMRVFGQAIHMSKGVTHYGTNRSSRVLASRYYVVLLSSLSLAAVSAIRYIIRFRQ